jgi:hypothetical protein
MEMRFPVICVPVDLAPYGVSRQEELGVCAGALYWRGRIFSGMRIVDSDGRTSLVTGTRVVRPASAAGQWLARLLDLQVGVELTLSPVAPVTIDELRERVTAAMQEDPEAVEELSGRAVAWWERALTEADTPAALARDLMVPRKGDRR